MKRIKPRFGQGENWIVTHSKERDGLRMWKLGAGFTTAAVAFQVTEGNWEPGMKFTSEKGEFVVIEGNGNGRQALMNI